MSSTRNKTKHKISRQGLTNNFRKFVHELKSHFHSASDEDMFNSFMKVMYDDIKSRKSKEGKKTTNIKKKNRKSRKTKKKIKKKHDVIRKNSRKSNSSIKTTSTTKDANRSLELIEASSSNNINSSFLNTPSIAPTTSILKAGVLPTTRNLEQESLSIVKPDGADSSQRFLDAPTVLIKPSFSTTANSFLITPPLCEIIAGTILPRIVSARETGVLSTSGNNVTPSQILTTLSCSMSYIQSEDLNVAMLPNIILPSLASDAQRAWTPLKIIKVQFR
eukprot:gene12979-14314_t